MPSLFPSEIQTFPQMIDLTASDGSLVQQYQSAMQAGNITLAKQILAQIPNNQNKIITADYLNTINDTLVAVEQYFQTRYSPAYVVSNTRPLNQETGDFWFEITG